MMSNYTGGVKGMRDEGGRMRNEAVDRLSVVAPYANTTVEAANGFDNDLEPGKKRTFVKVLKMSAVVMLVIATAAGIGGYFYWENLKTRPQYSLALLIEAARNNDQAASDSLTDTDAAVDDFVPQVTSKAIELFGRGLPPQTLARVERIAMPLLPAVKDRAREELPRLIREKTAKFENVPFAGMVLGADGYLEVTENGNEATVRSKLPEHAFEVRMTRSGDRWKIVGVRDEKLATAIAQKIGQEIVAIASNSPNGNAAKPSNLKNIQEVIREAQEIFR